MERSALVVVRRVFACALVVLAAACSEGPTAPTAIAEEFTLAPGGARRIDVDEAELVVRFVEVVGDSRCPADALCVLGGDAVVRVIVESAGRALTYELHTATSLPVRHGNVTVALVGLEPYPFSAHPIEPHEYRATLRVWR